MSGITLPDEGWLYTAVDLSDNTTAVHVGRALLRRLIVTTVMSAHAILVEDTGTNVAGLAASGAVGTTLDCGDLLCLTGITVTPNASSTGIMTLVYKPLHDTANASPGPFPK